MEGKVELEVLNPEGKIKKKGKTLAPRLETLEGKKIGLVWNGKPVGDKLLYEIGKLLKERYPTAETAFHRVSFSGRKLPPGELEAIANDVDAGVFTSGD
jgi:hypothetical protein